MAHATKGGVGGAPVGIPRAAQVILRLTLGRDGSERALGDLGELSAHVGTQRGGRAARLACYRECGLIVMWAAIDFVRRSFEPRRSFDSRRPMIIEAFLRDVRHGARGLVRSPGFTAIALLTLALGIGANTAIFSVVERVVLRPVEWPEAERVAVIGWDWRPGETTWGLTPAKAQFWKENSRSFEAFAIADRGQFVLTGAGEPQQVGAELVSAGYFDVIGMRPALGRAFVPEEDAPGGASVVILTDGFWRRSFGGDPAIVGREIVLDRVAHTVVGVMPPEFRPAEAEVADVLVPLRLVVDPASQGHNYVGFGRLAPTATYDGLTAEAAALKERFASAYPGVVEDRQAFNVIAYEEYLVGDFVRTAVWVLFAAVTAVLLIACANVSSLLLSRADTRRRELAVRSSLGASRARIVSHLVTESALLALLAGALGVLFARWWLDAILALAPEGVPGMDRVSLNIPVLTFALGVSLLTGIVIGVIGAAPVLRHDAAVVLRESGRASTPSAMRVRVRGLLIMAETAFAVVLLVGTVLLLVSFYRLRSVDPGFDPEGVYAVELRLPADRYSTTDATWRFEEQVLARMRALPGVVAAASASNLPLVRGLNTGATVRVLGEERHDVVELRSVSPDFLDLIGVRPIAGRAFAPTDRAGAGRVALVNESFVRRFLSDVDPIGAAVSVDGPDRTIVGVLPDLKDFGLNLPARPTVYAPLAQLSDGATRAMNEWFIAAFVIRTSGAAPTPAALRRAVQEVDPEQPILRMRSLTDVVNATVANERFNARLIATFGGLALALTAIGVYGVVSYSVGQRTHEIGLRMALGAPRTRLIGLVVWQGMGMVIAGVIIGVIAAAALTRLLSGLVFGVSTSDPLMFAAAALLIGGVALLASYVPARRASRVHPLAALRAD